MRERIRIQACSVGLDDELARALGDRYGGLWYRESDGRIEVGVAPGTDVDVSRAVIADRGVTQWTDLVPVRVSQSELYAALDALRADVEPLVRIQQVVVGIGMVDGTPAIRVETATGLTSAQSQQVDDAIAASPAPAVRVRVGRARLGDTTRRAPSPRFWCRVATYEPGSAPIRVRPRGPYNVVFQVRCNFLVERLSIRTLTARLRPRALDRIHSSLIVTGGDPGDRLSCDKSQPSLAGCTGRSGGRARSYGFLLERRTRGLHIRFRIRGGIACKPGQPCPRVAIEKVVTVAFPGRAG